MPDGFDILPDGKPIEAPEANATPAYENIPAPLGQMLSEQVGSTTASLGRVAEQGQYEGAGLFPRLLYGGLRAMGMAGEAESGTAIPTPTPQAGTAPSPMLTPEQYNDRYAPIGNDGKPVSLGDGPLPEGVAKLVGDAKHDELERENVTARFENVHSWPTNFAAGTMGFMLDPLRAATAFVPGIGEEAVLARLGAGITARIGARVVAGATAGAAAQLPLSALQYGLGQEEASDYGLRDAFRDLAFAAAGNAIFHTGIGTAGEILRGREGVAPEAQPAELAEARPILQADTQTQHAAMSSAVAEMADGRPVDVVPMFQLRTPEPIEVGGQTLRFLEPPPRPMLPSDMGPPVPAEIAAQQRELYHDGFAPGVPDGDLRQATADVYEPEPLPPGEAMNTFRTTVSIAGREMTIEGPTAAGRAAAESGGAPAQPEGEAPAVPETQEPRAAEPLRQPVPKEPERLINFLRRNGGVNDEGGDVRQTVGGARNRPGLINNRTGMGLDEAAMRAWQDGYLPGAARPDINALLDAIEEDHKGAPRYSEQDAELVAEHQAARARNSEIDRLSQDLGIETGNKTSAQFWDEVSERMSTEDAAREATDMAAAHEEAFTEAEAKAKQWMEEHGGGNPEDIYQRGEPRSLDDLEREFRQREAAEGMGGGAGGNERPGPAGEREGALQEGERPGGGGIGLAGLPRPATERTEQGEQLIIPGAERSAQQAMQAREVEGRGRIRASATQAAPGGMFEEKAAAEPELFDLAQAQQTVARLQDTLLPEERDEIAAAQRGLGDAETKAAAIDEAAACLKEAGL